MNGQENVGAGNGEGEAIWKQVGPRLVKSCSRHGKWVLFWGAGNEFMDVGLERTLEPSGIPVWMVLRLSTRSTHSLLKAWAEPGNARQEPRGRCVPKQSLGTR